MPPSPLDRGTHPDAICGVERARCLRAVSQTAPGRLRASFPSVLRPRRGVLPLHRDSAKAGNTRRNGSWEAWPGAEPECDSPGENRGEAPEGERAPQRARCRARASAGGNACLMRRGQWMVCAFRRFASPRAYLGANPFRVVQQNSDAPHREIGGPRLLVQQIPGAG
jgi:hypothetical protein